MCVVSVLPTEFQDQGNCCVVLRPWKGSLVQLDSLLFAFDWQLSRKLRCCPLTLHLLSHHELLPFSLPDCLNSTSAALACLRLQNTLCNRQKTMSKRTAFVSSLPFALSIIARGSSSSIGKAGTSHDLHTPFLN